MGPLEYPPYIPPTTAGALTLPGWEPDLNAIVDYFGGPTLGAVLYGLRMHESGGNYRARSPNSTASGAYQYIDSTWGNQGGFPRAYLAPPAMQDERAARDLAAYRERFGSWERAVAYHFTGDAALVMDRSRWNEIPGHPSNPTVNAFVASVMRRAEAAPADAAAGAGGEDAGPPPEYDWRTAFGGTAGLVGLAALVLLLGVMAFD